MKITQKLLLQIIKEEKKKILSEGCGCGGSSMYDTISADVNTQDVLSDDESIGYDTEYTDQDSLSSYPTTDREFLTKDEAVKSVIAIAMATSCPVTRETLLSAVEELV